MIFVLLQQIRTHSKTPLPFPVLSVYFNLITPFSAQSIQLVERERSREAVLAELVFFIMRLRRQEVKNWTFSLD